MIVQLLIACGRPTPLQVWEDGQAFYELRQRQSVLSKQREELEAARKALKRRLQPPPSAARSQAAAAAAEGDYLTPEEYTHRDEVLKVRWAPGRGVTACASAKMYAVAKVYAIVKTSMPSHMLMSSHMPMPRDACANAAIWLYQWNTAAGVSRLLNT